MYGNSTNEIIGHRGACGYAPENTIVSIIKAHELGIKHVEFDVKLTGDGEVILIHDDTLDRTTDGSGSIGSWSLRDVQRLDAGSWFSKKFSGERIPTLKDALLLLNDLSLSVNIEIKPSSGRELETTAAVCTVIKRFWHNKDSLPLVSSFSEKVMGIVSEKLPACDRALIVMDIPNNWQSKLCILGCNALHAWFKPLKKSNVREIKKFGYLLRCYTVNDLKLSRRLFGWGVDGIFSDFPDKLLCASQPHHL